MRKIALCFPAMANETRNFPCQRLCRHNGPFAAIASADCARRRLHSDNNDL
jgi:hypothetical protein